MARASSLRNAPLLAVFGALLVAPAFAQATDADLSTVAAIGRPTPFVIGGVRLDPGRLVPSTTPVKGRGTLVVGLAEHAGTATLAREMHIESGIPNDRVAAGAILHRVEFARQTPTGTTTLTTWCGTLGRINRFGRPAPLICFVEGDPTHRAYAPISTQSWLNSSMVVSRHPAGHADHLDLEPSATDLIGPMDVRFDLLRVTRREVTVQLVASRSGQGVIVMTMTRPVVEGKAVIPLWDRRLELTVDGDLVTPAILQGGNDLGPPEFGVYP